MAFGIKWNPVKDIKRAVSDISNSGNAIGSQAVGGINSFLVQAGQGIGNTLADLGKNVERNVQNEIESIVALTQPGGFNNIFQTGIARGARGLSGGLMNPDDISRISGPTNVDRMQTDAATKAANTARDQAARDAQAQIDDSNRQVSTFLASLSGGRMRQPGRSQTLLSTPGASQNTLLTLR